MSVMLVVVCALIASAHSVDMGAVNAHLQRWSLHTGLFVDECSLLDRYALVQVLADPVQRLGIAECAQYTCVRHWLMVPPMETVPPTTSPFLNRLLFFLPAHQKQAEKQCALTCYYNDTQPVAHPLLSGPDAALMEVTPTFDVYGERRWARGHLQVRATTMNQTVLQNMVDCLTVALADVDDTAFTNATNCLNRDTVEAGVQRTVLRVSELVRLIPFRYCVLPKEDGGFG